MLLMVKMMTTQSPVPTKTPPTLLWLSRDMYLLQEEAKRVLRYTNYKYNDSHLLQSTQICNYNLQKRICKGKKCISYVVSIEKC